MDLPGTVYFPPKAKRPWTLQSIYNPASMRFYGFARHALADALAMIGVIDQNVLLPSFICRDVLASVHAAGAKPVFYDVKEDLTVADDTSHWPKARAVLAVNYFGFAQHLKPFELYAKKQHSVLIEDSAHALFSRAPDGQLLGTRAPLGILSPRKSLPIANGGVLLINDKEYRERIPDQLPFQAVGKKKVKLKSMFRPVFALTGARIAFKTLKGLRTLRGDPSGHIMGEPNSEKELPKPAEPTLEWSKPLTCADPSVEISRRRALWAFCDGIARKISGVIPLHPSLEEGTVPYVYAFRSDNPQLARQKFDRVGLNILPWPDLPHAVLSSVDDHFKNIFLVHFLW